MSAAARTYTPLWPFLEPRIVAAQPSGQLPKPNGNGWIGGIFSPLRQEDRPSFSVKPDSETDPGGFEDHGTGDKGPISKLAKLMNVDPHVSSSPTDAQPQTFATFCATRKLDPDILTKTWGVRQVQWHDKRAQRTRPALRYPTALGIDRIKYLDKGPKLDKYIWAGQGGHRHWYGLDTALQMSGPLYLVNGEPSVWAAQQEGVAAICLCGGEGAAPTPELVASLVAAGVDAARVLYDLDDKGRSGAPKSVAALQAGAIDATAYELPSFLGAGGDVDDLHRWTGSGLADALAALPKLEDPPTQAATGVATRRYLTEDEIDTLRPPTWLIKATIPAGEVTLISGPGDAGKTFVVVDMMKRVAQHYPVLYAALEDAPGIRIRKRAWEIHHNLPRNGNFLMWTQSLDLFDSVSVDSFIAEVLPLGLRMITIDTLSRCLGGAEENSNTDMAIVMNNCERIAHATGAAVVVIHHTTKDGQAYRGASALKNNTYGHIEVSNDDDLVQFKIGRIKNTRPAQPRYFRLITVPTPDILDEEGKPHEPAVIMPADHVVRGDELSKNELNMLESLLLMTDADGGAPSAALERATGLIGNAFYRPLRRLKQLRLAEKTSKRAPIVITDEGRQRLASLTTSPDLQGGYNFNFTAAFEVNTHLDPKLPNCHGSNGSGSNPGSNGSGGSATPATAQTATLFSASESVNDITANKLPNSIGSNGSQTAYHSPPLERGSSGSNPDSNPEILINPAAPLQVLDLTDDWQEVSDGVALPPGADIRMDMETGKNYARKIPPKESDLSHDKKREAEAETFLAHGDLKAARRAAGHIRGNVERQRVLDHIDDIAAGVTS